MMSPLTLHIAVLCGIFTYMYHQDQPFVPLTVQAADLRQSECQNILAMYYEIPETTISVPNYEQLIPYFNETVQVIDFAAFRGNLGGSGRSENVGAVYLASLRFPFAGRWIVCLGSDNDSRLFFDNLLVETVVNTVATGFARECFETNITSVQPERSIRLEFFQTSLQYALELSWEGPSTPREIIPSCAFEPYVAPVPPTSSPCGVFRLGFFMSQAR
jgi:hypothetical protein